MLRKMRRHLRSRCTTQGLAGGRDTNVNIDRTSWWISNPLTKRDSIQRRDTIRIEKENPFPDRLAVLILENEADMARCHNAGGYVDDLAAGDDTASTVW